MRESESPYGMVRQRRDITTKSAAPSKNIASAVAAAAADM